MGHAHSHGGGHSHAPADFGRAFAIGVALNLGFVAVEAGYGLASRSLALVADAGHNLSDVLGLLLAWGATALARRAPSARFSYGLRSTSILAALANALLLLVAIGIIAWEAFGRLAHPEPVAGVTVMVVAGIGTLVNAGTAWLFASGRKGDLNVRGAFLHMAADALVSVGVVVSGFAILRTGWLWLDPATSLVVALMVLLSTWGLLRDSVRLALAGVPEGTDLDGIRGYLASRPGVAGVHDLHVWAMSTTETALTAHLVRPASEGLTSEAPDGFLRETAEGLHEGFGIEHATLQIEWGVEDCPVESDAVV